ncbi:MAG: hypothetical protein FWD91_00925 [Treponema sp.]|nr:hypothetical protein [Treponema sp.]
MKEVHNNELVNDIVNACAPFIGRESASNGLRALSRAYGGQNILIPQKKMDGVCAERILSVLEDEIGGADAKIVFEKLVAFYGGLLIYIPVERHGFRRDIALEIFIDLNKKMTVGDFCRRYSFTNTQVYRLWHIGQKIYLDEHSPCLQFD